MMRKTLLTMLAMAAALSASAWEIELLTNGDGSTLNGWTNTGSNPKSQFGIFEDNSGVSWFGSSRGQGYMEYDDAKLSQTVTLAGFGISESDIARNPTVTASGIVLAAQGSTNCTVKVYELTESGSPIAEHLIMDRSGETIDLEKYFSSSFQIDPATRKLKYELNGMDRLQWEGFYGPKFRNCSLKLNMSLNLADKEIYTVTENTTLQGTHGISPINVAAGARAVINIKNGATLTVKGQDASGTNSGTAAIYLTPSSTLYIVGDGTLIATGGNAANGGNGNNGENASRNGSQHTNGGGGSAGAGGGGAGSGIGGSGGGGAAAGSGAAKSEASRQSTHGSSFPADGEEGGAGANGTSGSACGKVVILGNVSVAVTGGAAGGAGSAGWSCGDNSVEEAADDWHAGGGGPGGAGGGGGAAMSIGGGGGGGGGGGDDLTGEFVKKTFVASNKLQLPYRVAAKADPNGGKVPVVVFLHGYGQCGVDNSFTINEMSNIQRYLDGAGGPSGYKLLVPQCPNDVKWAEFSMNSTTCTFQDKPSAALQAVFDLLDAYAAMSDVDADRIYVTGLSMGGHGTWDAICRRPDFFAAAMPCCGGGDPACAADIAHVPVLAVHNRGDPTIPVEQTEGIVTALRALGSDVIFEKLENNSHDAWTTCYATEDDVTAGAPNHRFVWMFAQNRATNNRPKYPRITELAAAPSGSNATISLTGVVLGTDADSVPATKYSVTYKLDGGAAATALSDQTTDSSFTLEGLADGNHTCEVTMTTDQGRTKTKSVVFYVNTSAVSDVWTSAQMDEAGDSFSTEGTFVYGYVCNGGTVNGIPFERSINLQSSENPPKISFTPNIDGFTGDFLNEGVGGNFGLTLGNGWYWDSDGSGTHTVTLTLSNLEGGKKYLVQFLAHNFFNNTTIVSANGCDPVHIHGDNAESGKYGALVTGVFTAVGATKDVTITYQGGSGKMPFNAVQVRELDGGGGGGGGATVVEPSIGSVTATPSGSTASLFLSGIVMGTDDAGTNATSYSVSYALNGGTSVAALANQTTDTASFSIENLADGSYACAVTVTTDKGKTATKSVSFAVSTSGGGGSVVEGWTVGPMAADGSTIRTDGTLLYAYCSPGGTVGGVPFARAVNLDAATMVSASPASAGNSGGSFGDGGATGDFGNMLRDGWYWTGEEVPLSFTLTLSGLTAGHAYLVQLVSHRTSNSTTVSANGSTPVYIHGTHDGVDYTYGASLVGVFTATGATADITVTYPTGTGNRPLNAIQVRDLGEAGGGGFQDWPEDPDTAITDATSPADLGLTGGAFAEAGTTTAELRRLSKWARANGVPFGGADVNAMSFDADGNPDNALSAAYLLNCAVAGLDEGKAAFRFAGIDPGTVPSIAGTYNGTVTVFGADAPSGPWQPATDQHHFYRAILTR